MFKDFCLFFLYYCEGINKESVYWMTRYKSSNYIHSLQKTFSCVGSAEPLRGW